MEKAIKAKALNRQYNAFNTIPCFKKQLKTIRFIENMSQTEQIPMELIMINPEVFDHIEETGAIYHYIAK